MMFNRYIYLTQSLGEYDASNKYKHYNFSPDDFNLTDGDYLYVGMAYKFCNLFFYLKGFNSDASGSGISVEYYDGSMWRVAEYQYNGTKLLNVAFSKSGSIFFEVKGLWPLSKIVINNKERDECYWVRLAFTGVANDVQIAWLGHCFGDDSSLALEHPDLLNAQLIQQWQTGKTNWTEQFILASGILVNDLIGSGKLGGGEQIIDSAIASHTVVPKVAEIIFSGMGVAYAEAARECRAEYQRRLAQWPIKLSSNDNKLIVGRLYR